MNETVSAQNPQPSKPSVSARKASANRANAQPSTGPRTAQGKATSSLNALRHGILARAAFNIVIEGEQRRAEFEAIVAGLAQEFQPRTMTEHLTVQQLAGCYWKLAKVWTYEQEAAWRGWTAPMPLEEFHEYERHYHGVSLRDQVLKNQNEFFPLAGLGAPTIPNGASARTILRYHGAINNMISRCLTILERRRKERMQSDEAFEQHDYLNEPTSEPEPSKAEEKPVEAAPQTELPKRTQKDEADASVSPESEVKTANSGSIEGEIAPKTSPKTS
jgi:hypothetical protein